MAANVGLYYENGTVIDEDCYASAITTLQAAATGGAEVAFEARNVNAVSNFAWEDGGLSSDPAEALRMLVFGVALVTIMLFRPEGLFPKNK